MPVMRQRCSVNGISGARLPLSRKTRVSTSSTVSRPALAGTRSLQFRRAARPRRPISRWTRGPQIVEAKRDEPLRAVKPYTEEVRREIDWELAERGIDFMTRQKALGKPFFLYLPISRTHFPNLPSKRFEGQSRIGQFGDSLMEGDAIVGRMLDALKDVGLDDNTIVVFASDNGPQGSVVREFGGGMPDMGSPGPHRGELGDVSEGSIRTAAMIRWPGHIRPRPSYTMFSIMDFFPKLPASRQARCRTTAQSTP